MIVKCKRHLCTADKAGKGVFVLQKRRTMTTRIEETVNVISNEKETDSEGDVLLAYRELSASKKKRLLAYISMLQNTK